MKHLFLLNWEKEGSLPNLAETGASDAATAGITGRAPLVPFRTHNTETKMDRKFDKVGTEPLRHV